MKSLKIVFLLAFASFSLSAFCQDVPNIPNYPNYEALRMRYSTKGYVAMPGDRHNVVASGVASAFLPGLGECLNGEWGRGMGKFGIGLFCVGGASASTALMLGGMGYRGGEVRQIIGFFGILLFGSATIALDVWSVIDAVRIAKVKNLYERDCRKASADVRVLPKFDVLALGDGARTTAGLSLVVNF